MKELRKPWKHVSVTASQIKSNKYWTFQIQKSDNLHLLMFQDDKKKGVTLKKLVTPITCLEKL